MAKKEVKKKHAKYSASGAYRWLNCSGSIALIEKAPEPKESIYALEGTAAHALAEISLKKSICPTKIRPALIPKEHRNFVTDEMRLYVKRYVDYVESFWGPNDKLMVEVKADLSMIDKEFGGTNDCLIKQVSGDLHIFDLKYGQGVKVDVQDNAQLAAYALGAAFEMKWDFDRLFVHIVQPRKDEWFQMVELTEAELGTWKMKFQNGISACEGKKASLKAGEWCKFCPAKPICPALKEKAIAVTNAEFDSPVLTLKGPQELTLPQVIEVLKHSDTIESWLESVRAYAHDLLERGKEVPGYKLVDKRAMRRWKTDQKEITLYGQKYLDGLAQAILGIEAFEIKLKSPAQLEKLNSKAEAFVGKWSEKVSSGTKIAPITDDREARRPRVESEFE